MYYLVSFIAFLIGCLPMWIWDVTAHVLAFISWDILHLRRRVMEKNIEIALGDSCQGRDRSTVGRKSYYHFYLTVLEFLGGGRNDLSTNVEFKGGEHIHQALEGGNGCYILVAHIGNWEAFGACVSRGFAPAYIAVKNVGSQGVNRFVEERRQLNGLLVVNRSSPGTAIRQMFSVLKRGEIVGFILDQRRPGEPMIPFFGRPTQTNTSLAAIWQRRPAPVIPGVGHRTAVGHHQVEFFPALELPPLLVDPKESPEQKEHLHALTLEFNLALEKLIRRYPEQYLWQHNRWKI